MATLNEASSAPSDFYDYFPEKYDDPKSGTFELGLVMGGTVSAGAYTAGVIDFLVEALDAWSAYKLAHPTDSAIPSWKVKFQAMAGTSGGGVIAALLGRALSFKFPPVRKNCAEADQLANPLYRVWVKEVDIARMLDLSDLGAKRVVSLLNPEPLEKSRDLIAGFEKGFPGSTRVVRNYLAEPLPIYLTLSNLKGIPYRVDMGGNSQSYVDHADYARMAVFTQGGNIPLRPDEFGVSDHPGMSGPGKSYLSWADFAEFALGTAAFPVGFPLRALSRPVSHLRYRPAVVPDDSGKPKIRPLIPDWQSLMTPDGNSVTDPYHFLTADGGMIDNEPIELCRRAIAGWIGRNPRNGSEAKRAIVLIDPFAEPPNLGPERPQYLEAAVESLLGAWKDQARYDSRDIMLATDEDCFSRFMITATRGDLVGSLAIATASVGAFGGFLCEAYRRHDYLLGRANCQHYLRTKLVLPEDNPLFAEWKSAAGGAVADWIVMDGERRSLPIIPLFGDCRTVEQIDPYPVGAFSVHDQRFQDLLEARIDEVLDRVKNDIVPTGLLGFLAGPFFSLIGSIGEEKLKNLVIAKIDASLNTWKLN